MAAGDVVYGTRTVLANVSRLHSAANNVAVAFGEIDNTTLLALDYEVHLVIPINPSATAGTYQVFLVSSQEGTEWTDDIDPANATDYADSVKDARPVRAMSTVYDNSPAGARTEARIHFFVSEIFPGAAIPKYIGILVINKSGQSIPAAGADGDSVSIKIATS